MDCRSSITQLWKRASMLCLPIAVAGCCGSSLYSFEQLPEPISFNVAMPVEAHVPTGANREVSLPMRLTNTSSSGICIGRRMDSAWQGGLEPVITVDKGSAPVDPAATSVVFEGLEGETIGRGSSIEDAEKFRLRLRLAANQSPGATGTMRVAIGLRRPDQEAGQPYPSTTIPIDVVVRKPGIPVLKSDPLSFNSEVRSR